jgi:hypothetical protein
MMAADVRVLTWSKMNTGSRRYRASMPMSTLLATHIAQARRLTPAEQCSRPRCTTWGTYASMEIAIPATPRISNTLTLSALPLQSLANLSAGLEPGLNPFCRDGIPANPVLDR